MRTASMPLLLAAALVNIVSDHREGDSLVGVPASVGARSLPLALRATFAGAGLNNVLVANGGEAARVVFVARSAHVPSAKVLATLALERLFELVGYVVLLSLAATFLSLPEFARARQAVRHHGARDDGRACSCGCSAARTWWRRWSGRSPPTGRAGSRAYGSRFMQTIGQVSSGPRFIAAVVLSVVSLGAPGG